MAAARNFRTEYNRNAGDGRLLRVHMFMRTAGIDREGFIANAPRAPVRQEKARVSTLASRLPYWLPGCYDQLQNATAPHVSLGQDYHHSVQASLAYLALLAPWRLKLFR